jgi:Tfp pilus assembly protein PilN
MSSKLSIGKKSKTEAVIYFDQDVLKLMVKTANQNDEMALTVLLSIEGKTDQEISDLIKRHLGVFRTSQTRFILALPRNLVTVKNVVLPSSRTEEIDSMIEFQVPRLVPYPRSEIIYDYQVLSSTDHDCTVRAAVVHRKSVDKYFAILGKSNIIPSSVMLCSDAVPSSMFENEASGSFLELDYSQSHWVFFENGKIRFSRSIPVGVKDILKKAGGPDVVPDFLNQLEASISLFLTQQNMADTVLHLVGASRAVELLEAPILEKLGLKIVKHPQDIRSRAWVGKDLNESASLCGLYAILNRKKFTDELDLTPKDIQSRFERKQNLHTLKKLALTGAAALLLGGVVYGNEIRLYQKELDAINREIKGIQSAATELEDLKRKAYLLKYHVDHRGDCLNVFTSLLGNIPEDIYLKTVGWDSNKVSLKGYASNLSKIFELTALLQKNDLFNKIDTQYARQGESGRQEMAEFHLECWLKNEITERQGHVQSAE